MTQTGFKLVNEPCRGVHFQDKLATLVLSFHLSTAVNYTAPHDLPKTVISDRRADRKFGSGKKKQVSTFKYFNASCFQTIIHKK